MKPSRFLALLAASLVLATPSARAAIGVTVSPSVISNDYQGVLTLTVTGLTNGQPVRIEKFADFNLNGALDTGLGESLVQSFPLQDGLRSPVYGGGTNFNVPGDTDGATNGAITARLQYAAGSEGNRSGGRYVFRAVNPVSLAVLATATFTVNQAAQAQRITGTVRAAVGGGVLSNAFVILLSPGSGGFLDGVLSDAGGNYTFPVAVGSYSVNAIKSGFVTFFNQSANVTVGAGQMVTTNVNLTATTRTVSGRVTDATTTLGLAGVQLTFGGDDSQSGFALGFTDGNGNFAVPVPAGSSGVGISESSVALLGYVGPANETMFDTTAGNVTGLNIALSNATALVYGRLTNHLGQPLGGVRIEARDQNGGAFRAEGVATYADGNYAVGVLPGQVNFGPDTDDLMPLGLLPAPGNVMTGTLAAGGGLLANLGGVPPSAHLRGRVLLDPGAGGVAGVRVYASPQNSGGSFDAQTAADGSFDIGVGAGVYYVGVSDDDLSGRGLVASQLQLTVVDGVDQNNLVLVARTVTRQITGQVTGDGAPLGNVNVFANISVNGTNFSAFTSTDGGGQFSLGVFNGTWQVGVSCNGNGGVGTLGFTCVNNQTVVINGANGTANFALTACGALQVTTTAAQLGSGQVEQFYFAQIQASGCGQSFNFSLSPGSGALPPGLNLYNDGNLSGTPTSSGTGAFLNQ